MKLMQFKLITLIMALTMVGAYGQKQSKTYNEVFNVNAKTVLDIDTNNTDIEFETWDKEQIAIEAIVEIEGATGEEAEHYFERGAIEIVGNSEKIKVSSGKSYSWSFNHTMDVLNDIDIEIPNFHFEMPELPEMPEIEEFHIEMADIPPVPPVPNVDFDYEAYEKEGEKYLKRWQKKFQKGFDKDYQRKMEEWSAKMEVKRAAAEKRLEKMEVKRERMMEKRMEAQERRLESQEKRREVQARRMEEHAAEMEKQSAGFMKRETIFFIIPMMGKVKNMR